MPNIQILSESVKNLIAAGEVVERPASVVKELVENAIDAGAGEIRVDILEGGLKKIAVSDDGCGMDASDLGMCVLSHATSKLKNPEDLANIMTMGFRGEALPSIAAVSKITIESKPKGEAVSGNMLKIDGGKMLGVWEKGLADGTKITVEDIFFNTPARKKFMRTPRTEIGHIKDAVERLALANPGIRFQLVSDEREIISANTLGDSRQRTSEIFGSDLVRKSYRCNADAGVIRVYGLVGDPETAQDGSKGFYWFVNCRPVRDRMLNHAVSEAYKSLLPRGMNPFTMLFISLPPADVDVNVHPTKNEVRFQKGSAVHDFVVGAVKKALASRREGRLTAAQSNVCHPCESRDPMQSSTRHPCESRDPVQSNLLDSCTSLFPPAGRFGSLRPIGQFRGAYLICEGDDGALVIIDQHAVHERIGYERLKEGYKNARAESQRLLLPEVVSVPSRCVGYMEGALADLAKIGWEIEYFGGDNFCVKAAPAILGDVNFRTIVGRMAVDLSEFEKVDSYEEKIDCLLKVTACHAQVRAGDRLTDAEIRHLLREMDDYEWSGRCPHGRPAVTEFELKDIEKWFARS